MHLPKRAAVFSLIFIGLLPITTGCTSKKYYPLSSVTVEKTEMDTGYPIIIYRTPLETLFYSSGCDASYASDSSEVRLKFIRQSINTPFDGNLKSEMGNINHRLIYKLTLTAKVKKAFVGNTQIGQW
jgi:hypothetical protein